MKGYKFPTGFKRKYSQEGVKLRWFKFHLWRAYFNCGIGLTQQIKYLIGFFGLSSLNVKLTLIIAGIWFIVAFFLGRWWYTSGMVISQNEVGNKFNLFMQEMRKRKHI